MANRPNTGTRVKVATSHTKRSSETPVLKMGNIPVVVPQAETSRKDHPFADVLGTFGGEEWDALREEIRRNRESCDA